MSHTLPEIGTDITTGYTVTHEGIVKNVFPLDFSTGPVTYVDFGDKNGISLRPPGGYSGDWELLEAAPKPLPAEPAVGSVVAVSDRLVIHGYALFWRRHGHHIGWYGITSSLDHSWAEVCALGTPVPLIAAPWLPGSPSWSNALPTGHNSPTPTTWVAHSLALTTTVPQRSASTRICC